MEEIIYFFVQENHETSKKHKENLEILIRDMQAEEYDEDDVDEDDDAEPDPDHEELDGGELDHDEPDDAKSVQDESDDVEVDDKDINPSNHKNEQDPSKLNESIEKTPVVKSLSDDEFLTNGQGKKKGKTKKKNKPKNISIVDSDEKLDLLTQVSDDSDFEFNKKTTKSKKNRKTAKEKVEDKENENKNICPPNPDPILPTNQHDPDENVSDPELKCGKCGSVFPSKNKLFNHLKSTGHALYLGHEKAKVKPADQKLTKKQKRKL